MKLRLVFALLTPCALLLAGCGDGTDAATTPPANGSATAGASATAGDPFGPAPVLGGNVLKITPAHGATVTQASTQTRNPNRPSGICAEVSFDGLPENGQWFRLVFDETEVTASKDFVWILTSTENPTGGRFCYAPPAGFSKGMHTAAIGVQNPSNPNAPLKQTVAWKFKVE